MLATSPAHQLFYSDYAARNRGQRNLVGIFCVLLIHALLAYMLVNGLGRTIIEIAKGPLQAKIVEDVKLKDELPPPPPKLMAPPPPPFIPAPEITIQVPAGEASNAIVAVTTAKPPQPAPPALEQADHEVSAKPLSGPPLVYPPRLLAEQRQGAVQLECTVESDGTTNHCVIVDNRGDYEFTVAAMNYVTAARYSPRVHNGVAVKEEHHRFNIVFKIQ